MKNSLVIIGMTLMSLSSLASTSVTSRECVDQFDHALTVLNGDEGVTFTRTSGFVEISDIEVDSRSFTLGAMVRIDSESIDEVPVTVMSENKFFTATCVLNWPASTNYKMMDSNNDEILNQSDFTQLNIKN